MIPIYKPTKIIEARLQVENEHSKVERGKAREDDEILKALILRIVSLKTDEVAAFLAGVSERQIHQISEYICLNFWNVELTNLFTAILERGTIEEWETIFSGWQNHYDKKTDGEAIRKFLYSALYASESFQKYVSTKNWTLSKLKWLSDNNFIEQLCFESCKNSESFSDELLRHGVIYKSLLYEYCSIVFFQQCGKKDYLFIGAAAIKEKYLTWTRNDKIKFCMNLYEKLDDVNLDRMRVVLISLDRDFKEREMKSILTEKGYQLYLAWKNIKVVDEAFSGYADRYRRTFWMKYIKGNRFQNYSHTCVVDFGNYVAVEFKGKAAGPTYLYKKDFFQKVVLYQMLHSSKAEFQKWEYEKYQARVEGVCERLTHTENWTYKFAGALKSYGIKGH